MVRFSWEGKEHQDAFPMGFLTDMKHKLHVLSVVCFVLFQILFSGSQQCFENYETTRFYGGSRISHSPCKDIHQNLIRLLKSVVQMLEEDSRSSASPETPGKTGDKVLSVTLFHSSLLGHIGTFQLWNARKRDSPFWQLETRLQLHFESTKNLLGLKPFIICVHLLPGGIRPEIKAQRFSFQASQKLMHILQNNPSLSPHV